MYLSTLIIEVVYTILILESYANDIAYELADTVIDCDYVSQDGYEFNF